jgi:hypothetical protein
MNSSPSTHRSSIPSAKQTSIKPRPYHTISVIWRPRSPRVRMRANQTAITWNHSGKGSDYPLMCPTSTQVRAFTVLIQPHAAGVVTSSWTSCSARDLQFPCKSARWIRCGRPVRSILPVYMIRLLCLRQRPPPRLRHFPHSSPRPLLLLHQAFRNLRVRLLKSRHRHPHQLHPSDCPSSLLIRNPIMFRQPLHPLSRKEQRRSRLLSRRSSFRKVHSCQTQLHQPWPRRRYQLHRL